MPESAFVTKTGGKRLGVALVIGAILLGSGVILWIVSDPDRHARNRAAQTPTTVAPTPPKPTALLLWDKADYGMSSAQARAAYPAAAPPKGKPNAMDSGATVLLTNPSIEVVGRPFVADFFFLNDKLVAVDLQPSPTLGMPESEAVYAMLSDALRAKYGEAFKSEDKGKLGLVIREDVWRNGNVDVRLFLVGSRNEKNGRGHISVLYSTRLSDAAKAL